MSQIYFNSSLLDKLSGKELYFRFKIIEKRNTNANSMKIPYEMKMELDRMYQYYVNEIDDRVASGKLSYDDLDEWDDFFDEHEEEIIKLSNNDKLYDENIRKIQ